MQAARLQNVDDLDHFSLKVADAIVCGFFFFY